MKLGYIGIITLYLLNMATMQSDSWLMSHCWQNPLTLIYSCHFFYLNFAGQVWLDFQLCNLGEGVNNRYSLDQEGWLETLWTTQFNCIIPHQRFPLLPDSPISPPPLSPRSQRPIRKWFFHQILEKISPHMATRGWQNDKERRMFKFSSSLSTFSSLPSLI